MPRVYKRKAGSRPYLREYSEEDMKKALSDVENGRKSIRKAAAHYKGKSPFPPKVFMYYYYLGRKVHQ